MLSYEALSAAPTERAWALLSRPDRWSRWAPHVSGGWGLGAGEVSPGARGFARLLGVLPVPAQIVAKQPGRSWTWSVAGVRMTHRVEPRSDGCLVAVDLLGPRAIEPVLRATYGPVVAVLVRRLARTAERE